MLPDSLVDDLWESFLIDEQMRQDIQIAKTRYSKNDLIIKSILRKAGRDKEACSKFLDVIEKQSPGFSYQLTNILETRRKRGK